jgi:cob(I)alamin adenosyltransferase
MSITTKTGDEGYTGLLTGERVHKSDVRIELLGAVDELTSSLGIVKSQAGDKEIKDEIEEIQEKLKIIMAQFASEGNESYKLDLQVVNRLEQLVYKYESMYIAENKFILPGETKLSAVIDLARTIARRAERTLLSTYWILHTEENTKKYLNRLSDFLYALARYIDFKEEITKKVKERLEKDEIVIKKDNKISINLNFAKKLLERIEERASEVGVPVVIAVSNEWGNIIAVHFMDGALPGSYSIAVDKAYTSAVIRLSTEELGRLSQSGQPLFGINNTNNNRIVVFGGGVPLKINGAVVGGLGVSGGSAEQDIELAEFGLNVLKEGL